MLSPPYCSMFNIIHNIAIAIPMPAIPVKGEPRKEHKVPLYKRESPEKKESPLF
jgi:hypothetical protein